ncbi:614/534 cytochrome P450 [Dichomitus squalens LYAD-421 SS1]|uniref:614/534 cytochrome P450 n=1 Tax=Dichomitus squalens (strain LYAD-421) TaxID=732165 RepID=R7SSJ2_DICSQ|nr:614/534 cytochrome P450 [Dichomitus squalens LYAD-421 SS1]EJF57962.1 614/534 cytochrome P450 [Dichomitus squalens LYAD-421 SS1]
MLGIDNSQALLLLTILLLSWLVQKVVAFQRVARSVDNWPGFRTVFSDRTVLFPFSVRGLSPGPAWTINSKYAEFARHGWDVITGVRRAPVTKLTRSTPRPEQEIMGARARFPKPTSSYALLATFGTNILVTEGDEWKRQRKIAAPAFSEKNNRLVWDETAKVLDDVFQNVWGDRDVVELDNIMDLTVPVTLLVIGVAGFGRRMSWSEDQVAPSGHSMTFKDAMYEVSHHLVLKVLFPDWLLRWGTPAMRHFATAHDELMAYLHEMVVARRAAEVKDERFDLMSNLLDANEDETDSAAKLSDSALIGNVFLFLVAGYETTAHTLAFAFTLLALHQDEQEAFYQNLKSVLPTDREPTYEDFSSLSYSLAVMNETLRLFPPVLAIPKESAEDTAFTLTSHTGETRTLPVPAQTYIALCVASMHRNPRFWPEPDAFRPARFLGAYNRDAFQPFSGGPRGCIGRGFGETEGVAVLTKIVARYKVEVREEPGWEGETFERRKERLLRCGHSLTIFPERAPLVFRRR